MIKTTDYFNMTIEELQQERECGTREEAKILDEGFEHYWFETLDGLNARLSEPEWKQYVDEHNYDVVIFEMLVENTNHNKYCICCK